jgi:hypothetical protein
VNSRRVPRAAHLYEELCERLHLDSSARVRRRLAAGRTAIELPNVTWDALEQLDRRWCERIRAKALEYGYES